MQALDPEGSVKRFPGKKVLKVRGRLTDVAVYYEVHCDGHEKLNHKALKMGPASIDAYGNRCHSSGWVLKNVAVPNARCQSTIAHIYCDVAEELGGKTTPSHH
jgi:hypothetical protein